MKRFRYFINEANEPVGEFGAKPAVMGFGRMQPPTVAGHGKLISAAKNLANQMGAKHEIILSHSQDPEKNPLTPEQKLKHAKRLFPDTNISVASKELPTLIHHAARLNREGHDHLTLVAGDDRVNEYQDLLNRYNGKPDKSGKVPFHFKNGVRVVSAGERDGDAESATKIRQLVKDNNQAEFTKRYPTLHPRQSEELFNDLKAGMSKKVNEEAMTSSGGEVRGMGFVTGDPGGSITAWATLNAAEADTADQILNDVKNRMHHVLHVKHKK